MNRVMLGLLLAAGVALAWLWSEHQRQEEDRRLAEAVAKAV